jgi:uncharacterized membrane protein
MAPGFVGALVLTGLAATVNLGADVRAVLLLVLVALVLYGAAFIITVVVHVPLNNGLKAAGAPDAIADLAGARRRFNEPSWVRWNVVRAVVTTVAFACLATALVTYGRAW